MSPFQFKYVGFGQNGAYARWQAAVLRQPSFAWKFAIGAALAILVLPLMLLALTAMVTFVVVLVCCGVVYRIGQWLGNLFGNRAGGTPPTSGGRRNVRVIRVDE